MYKGQRIIAIIPARAGSKGIPQKNIRELNGHPLIAYSISAAKSSKLIDKVLVSTDSEEIRKIALTCGASVPFLRPDNLSGDTAKTIDCVLHALEALSIQGEQYGCMVLLQPTQPIRTGQLIDDAITKLMESDKNGLVSVCPVNEHPILMRTIHDDTLVSLLGINSTQRRQDFERVYRVNGTIYVNKVNEELNYDSSLNDNPIPFIMSEEESIDIDTLEDFKRAEQYIQSHQPFLIM